MGMLDLLLNDGNSTMVGVLVFLAAATLTFSVMAVIRVQGSVKRRAANQDEGSLVILFLVVAAAIAVEHGTRSPIRWS